MVIQISNSLSLSTITPSAGLFSPSITPNGKDFFNIVIINVSLLSDLVSLIIGMTNEEQFVPTGNVTRYSVSLSSA